MLVLDASGSMTTDDAPGPRIDAAKSAAKALVAELPQGSPVGLIAYGTSTGNSDAEKEAGCRDVSVVSGLRPLDRARIAGDIDRIRASGYTPIARALRTAAAELPTDGSAQSVVLVSDGEDTCGEPPCDVAAELKQTHPGLTINTIGFRTGQTANRALICIAEATGGIQITADNAKQLAARLLATRDSTKAQASLTSTGLADIHLGMTLAEIQAKHSDFVGTANSVVIWRDCEFTFDGDTLVSIAPRNGGRTIDGIHVGSLVREAVDLYGEPRSTTIEADGSTTAIFIANEEEEVGYRMSTTGYSADGFAGTINKIILCKCLPKKVVGPKTVTLTAVDASGSVQPGWSVARTLGPNNLDCSYNHSSRFALTSGVVSDCAPTAMDALACWPTDSGASAYCLMRAKEPNDWQLEKFTSTPVVATGAPPAVADPVALVLDDGTFCTARIGGSWGYPKTNPDYVGFYICSGGGFNAVWADRGTTSGITRSSTAWTVEVGSESGPLTTHTVTVVYYVAAA
ncbi:VWA domain-containing protein [Smaragdicoccus niigatensis]